MAAFAALVVLVSAAIYALSGGDDSPNNSAAGRSGSSAAPAVAGSWSGTWGAAPAAAEAGTQDGFAGMSIRNVVHTSIGGSRARIQLSNTFGNGPLTITHASVALAAAPSTPTAADGTMRRLTFSQRPSVTIPAGQSVVSDPVRLNVPEDADLLVTTYAPNPSGPVTYHPHARQISYLARGDYTEDANGTAYSEQSPYWRYLTGVDVWSAEARGSVVVLGDSLTDGVTSTAGANHRWPDFLADRLRNEPGAPRYGVVNMGISGNRLLFDGSRFYPNNGPSALTRLDRDVLSRAGVKAVVVELGINDILKPPQQHDPKRIVGALKRIVSQAHARGLQVTGGTLMPYEGHLMYSKKGERVRQAVNRQIRSGKVFDEVVDFDKTMRDPRRPSRLNREYDSGDHLHLNDKGYRAMAAALNLEHLKGSSKADL
ncbi:SGNH/GDSL hydrolase family protein [Streptomyces boninensis]|uniref:SGNH/GDSL hydrolase family protein n=1 Tax=Streptomyces boninensis TaxID=2039455 RepID=UPI003B22487D